MTKTETRRVNTRDAKVDGGIAYLEIPQLGKLLPTIVQPADEGLLVHVGIQVGTNIAALSEALVADITGERLFTRVTALVSLLRA